MHSLRVPEDSMTRILDQDAGAENIRQRPRNGEAGEQWGEGVEGGENEMVKCVFYIRRIPINSGYLLHVQPMSAHVTSLYRACASGTHLAADHLVHPVLSTLS